MVGAKKIMRLETINLSVGNHANSKPFDKRKEIVRGTQRQS